MTERSRDLVFYRLDRAIETLEDARILIGHIQELINNEAN